MTMEAEVRYPIPLIVCLSLGCGAGAGVWGPGLLVFVSEVKKVCFDTIDTVVSLVEKSGEAGGVFAQGVMIVAAIMFTLLFALSIYRVLKVKVLG